MPPSRATRRSSSRSPSTATASCFFGDEAVDAAEFARRVGEAARRNPQTEVQLRADKAVPYGRVAELIGTAQKAGLTRIGFVADPEK